VNAKSKKGEKERKAGHPTEERNGEPSRETGKDRPMNPVEADHHQRTYWNVLGKRTNFEKGKERTIDGRKE